MRRRTHARSKRTLLFVAMAAGGVAAAADAPPLPEDFDFLEYLGSWEADDADWVVANAAVTAAAPAASGMDSRQPSPTTIEKRGAVPSPATTERKP